MERLRIRRQHMGTGEESRTLPFSDRRIQQETFITEMNSASSEQTRLNRNAPLHNQYLSFTRTTIMPASRTSTPQPSTSRFPYPSRQLPLTRKNLACHLLHQRERLYSHDCPNITIGSSTKAPSSRIAIKH